MEESKRPLYSERLIDHFKNPRNVGHLAAPALTVELENPACGDLLRLSALLEDGIVKEAAFQARGCTATIACGSALTEWLPGRSKAELAGMSAQMIVGRIEDAVGGLPQTSKHAAALCADAVRALFS
jgi:nitrogen fixation protein NifU and related proteins